MGNPGRAKMFFYACFLHTDRQLNNIKLQTNYDHHKEACVLKISSFGEKCVEFRDSFTSNLCV